MPHATLGHALHALGFTQSEFWPQNADIRRPSDAQRYPFDPDARTPDKRYGPGAATAKGWPNGYPHGGNLDPINALVRHPSNPLDLENNTTFSVMSNRQNREDLNFLPGAYKRLMEMANQLQPQTPQTPPSPTPPANPSAVADPATVELAKRIDSLEQRLARLEQAK